jgi:hypothetical protein
MFNRHAGLGEESGRLGQGHRQVAEGLGQIIRLSLTGARPGDVDQRDRLRAGKHINLHPGGELTPGGITGGDQDVSRASGPHISRSPQEPLRPPPWLWGAVEPAAGQVVRPAGGPGLARS